MIAAPDTTLSEPVARAKHKDIIERLNEVFYIRWTLGPDYERAFLCVEDGEPDMNSFADTSFGCANIFRAGMQALATPPQADGETTALREKTALQEIALDDLATELNNVRAENSRLNKSHYDMLVALVQVEAEMRAGLDPVAALEHLKQEIGR